MTAKVVSIINLKGGVGKSTVAMILAEYMAFKYHKRVLAIDLDSQANLTSAMVRPVHVEDDLKRTNRTIAQMFLAFIESGQVIPASNLICPNPNWISNINKYEGVCLDMIISTPDLAGLDEKMLDRWEDIDTVVDALSTLAVDRADELDKCMPGIVNFLSNPGDVKTPTQKNLREIRFVLKRGLQSVLGSYDVVIIDCPPGLSISTTAAIVASDYFVSPVIPEPLSLLGIDLVQSRIAKLKNRLSDVKINYAGSILNKVLQWRNAHRTESALIYGLQAAHRQPHPAGKFKPFKWWIPDAEHLRKLGEFECHTVPDRDFNPATPGEFGFVHGKYGGTNVRLSSSKEYALDRKNEEGPQYYLSRRLERLTDEFMKRIGLSQSGDQTNDEAIK